MPTIIPISSHHCHEPMTQGQQNFILGILIALHLIWLFTSIIQITKYFIQKKKNNRFIDFLDFYFPSWSIIELWHWFMCTVGILELISLIGYIISLLL